MKIRWGKVWAVNGVRAAAAFVFVAASHAGAQTDRMLFDTSGDRGTTPALVAAEVPSEKVIADSTTVYDNGLGVVSKLLTQASLVGRRTPPADATNAQREVLAEQKAKELQTLVEATAGKAVEIGFVVEDIVSRPAPKEPDPNYYKYLRDPAAYAQAVEAYKRDVAVWEKQKMLLVGRLNVAVAGAAADNGQDPELRRQIADENRRYQERIKQLNELIRTARGASLDTYKRQKAQAEADHKEALVRLRGQMKKNDVRHYVYILGSDQSFMKWKRGQSRSVRAFVQKVVLFAPHAAPRYNGRSDRVGQGVNSSRQDPDAISYDSAFRDNPTGTFRFESILQLVQDEGETAKPLDADPAGDAADPAPNAPGAPGAAANN
jgi:hypothetical protein